MLTVVAGSSSLPPTDVRVLVVDDDETNRAVLVNHLQRWKLGHDVAAEALQALEILTVAAQQNRPFEVVLVDHQLPGIDGPDLAGRIRADPDLDGTKLVLVSSGGMGSTSDLGELFEFTIRKPLRQGALHDILNQLIGSSSTAPATLEQTATTNLCGRVLLVEDNLVNQRVGKGMLARLGLDVAVAGDGREALALLSDQHFDAILMDCQMPVMDGFEATRRIRRGETDSSQIPIIATTADVMVSTVEECRRAGMDSYLSKPYKLRDLRAALQPLLSTDGSGD
ncbi:response regulator [Methanothrix soehngenii]|uniref:response regulator n=1 Tax=Methanothrix soehngenii TaxID=2223 RepID=UPI00300D6BD2